MDQPSTETILQELILTKTLGGIRGCSGFVRLLNCSIVKGKWPTLLVKEWQAWKKRKGTENRNISENLIIIFFSFSLSLCYFFFSFSMFM